MRVLVTGCNGKIGLEATKALKAKGHNVIGCDINTAPYLGRVVKLDCTDFGEVMGAFSGVDTYPKPDAILHLAGIPAPGFSSDAKTFETNIISTYNVFSAAQRLGIKKIVWASSETIFGLPFKNNPAFLPLDETAPKIANWSYSMSKKLGEEMAEDFIKLSDIDIISLRFSNVFNEKDYKQIPSIHENIASRKLNLWAYIDAEDAGNACVLALESSLKGHEIMTIVAKDTLANIPTKQLIDTYFKGVDIKTPIEEFGSLLSGTKAFQKIGFLAQKSWRNKV